MTAPVPPLHRLWSFDAVEFDEARLELRVSGRAVSVQPLALKLLRCLLTAAPRVVARDELLAALWHRAPENVSRNVLSNAASRLRAAIGDGRGRRIVTVPGIGYRLAGPVSSRAAEPMGAGPGLPPQAQQFLMRHWFDALYGRKGFDPRLSLSDVLRMSIDQAETELADAPLALASLHRHLAEHDLIWSELDSAQWHFRRAMALHATCGDSPGGDALLALHFDLCRTLVTAAVAAGDAAALAAAGDELASARAAMAQSAALAPSTLLKAALAEWAAAAFHLDWQRAHRHSMQAMRLAARMPELPAPQWFSLQRNEAVTLARCGQLSAGIERLRALLTAPERPLPHDDIQVLATRLNLGQFLVLADDPAAAIVVLGELRDALAGNALALTAFGIDTDIWFGRACADAGESADASRLLRSAYQRASLLSGNGSERALSALVPLTRLMERAGEQELALRWLDEAVRPRLASLAMPAAREAVMALAHWARMLWSAGRGVEAGALLRRLHLPDLRAAVLRPGDAAEFEVWLRSARDQGAGGGKTSISVC